MAKVADIRLGWTRSPSTDVTKQVVLVTIDGAETTAEVGPDIQEWMITVNASKSVQFKVDSYDSEGNHTVSEVYSFVLGDLEAPQPATGLFHEVVAVRDESPVTPTPPSSVKK